MSKSNFNIYMKSNIPKFRKYLNSVIANFDKKYDIILEDICKEIVAECQLRLLQSGYDVSSLIKNITYQKYGKGKYRVGIKNNEQKDIMYFLEFGTGIVGAENKHPKSNDVGWKYIVNPDTLKYNSKSSGYNSLVEYAGHIGWWYFDEKEGKFVFTSGLKGIRYFYDTITKENINKIVKRILIKHKGLNK